MNIFDLTCKWAEQTHTFCHSKQEVFSTNGWAKSELVTQTFCLYLAAHQTHGVGRGQATQWINPSAGHSLLSSWVFKVQQPPHPLRSLLIGLGVYNALIATFPEVPFALKAPNDIYIQQYKLAGLLIENIVADSTTLIIGLGLNVLSKPIEVATSTCLSSWLLSTLTAPQWFQFLDRLSLELTLALETPLPLDGLSDSSRVQLYLALKDYPGYASPLRSVEVDGSLTFINSEEKWHSQ